MIDDITTLPSMFATIYCSNELRKKRLGTQENILCSLRFFYVYYCKKHKQTFDYDFYRLKYNIYNFIKELDGFFTYLLSKQHLNSETDIIAVSFMSSAISKANKFTYGNHVRNVGRFLNYLNYRYMNPVFQNMSVTEAHGINERNCKNLAERIKIFNKVDVSQNEPAHRYKSISGQQNIELMNMLLPSTPEFIDSESGQLYTAVINPQNPFEEGFQQYRNYLIHRLMFNYGLRVGEVLLLMKDCIGPSLPDSRGITRFILIVQNLPDNVYDPRKHQPSIKNQYSQRQIELTENDFIMFSIYINKYRDPLFEEKEKNDNNFIFIKGKGNLTPLTYDAVITFYKEKIDPAFINIYPYYRSKNNKNIDSLVHITPHVGRHTWAYITLEFIYNMLLDKSMALTQDYGIRARMNGYLEPAVEQLRALGGWSVTSNVPLKYAKRFVELISNQSNQKRTKLADQQLTVSDRTIYKTETNSSENTIENKNYDTKSTFKDLFN